MGDNFSDFVDATVDNLVSIVKTVTGADAEAKCLKTEVRDLDALKEVLASCPLVLRAPFKTGLTGGAAFLMRVEAATALADVFIGGTGAASSELSPDMKDAVIEIFNQLGGGLKTRLSADFGTSVALGPFDVFDFSKSGIGEVVSFLGFAPAQFATLSLKLGSTLDAEICLTTPVLVLPGVEEEEEPPTQMLATAAQPLPTGHPNLDLIMDVRLPVTVRFGQTRMILRDVLKLGTGSLIELDKQENEPVDLMVNDKVLARGEVVVVDGNYALRIIEIESAASRIRSLA